MNIVLGETRVYFNKESLLWQNMKWRTTLHSLCREFSASHDASLMSKIKDRPFKTAKEWREGLVVLFLISLHIAALATSFSVLLRPSHRGFFSRFWSHSYFKSLYESTNPFHWALFLFPIRTNNKKTHMQLLFSACNADYDYTHVPLCKS